MTVSPESVGDVVLADGVDLHVATAWIAARNIEHLIETGRLPNGRKLRTASGRTIDTTTLKIGIAQRLGLEMNVVPGRPVRVRSCGCGVFFVTQDSRELLCKEHRSLRAQTHCAGFRGHTCPERRRAPASATLRSSISNRLGKPWRCSPCAAKNQRGTSPRPCAMSGCDAVCKVQNTKFCSDHAYGRGRPTEPCSAPGCHGLATTKSYVAAKSLRRSGRVAGSYCAEHAGGVKVAKPPPAQRAATARVCAERACSRPLPKRAVHKSSYCSEHRYGRRKRLVQRPCSQPGCSEAATKGSARKHRATAFCSKHTGGSVRQKPRKPCDFPGCALLATETSSKNAYRSTQRAYCSRHRGGETQKAWRSPGTV